MKAKYSNRAGFLKDEIFVAQVNASKELRELYKTRNRSCKKHARLLNAITEVTVNRNLGFYERPPPPPKPAPVLTEKSKEIVSRKEIKERRRNHQKKFTSKEKGVRR